MSISISVGVCKCAASMCASKQFARMRRRGRTRRDVSITMRGWAANGRGARIMAEECNFRNENMRRLEVNARCRGGVEVVLVVVDCARLATCLEALSGISRRQIIMWFLYFGPGMRRHYMR